MLEEKWKREDQAPKISPFTGTSQINVDLPKDATPLDFLDLLLNDKFYEHLTFQTKLCAVRYIAAHLSPRYSCARGWKEVIVDEIKQFLVFYLNGIVRKAELGQYWSTSSVIKIPYFTHIMSQNRFQSFT